MTLRSEFRKGLSRTLPHLLAHHGAAQFDRCYTVEFDGRTIRICARCLGIYPGILLGILAFMFGPPTSRSIVLVYVLPAPALIDWARTTNQPAAGSNSVRTGAGLMLGYGYALGVCWLGWAFEPVVIGAAVVYGTWAAVLLAREHRSRGL